MSFELVCEWPFRCKPLEVNKQDGRKARQRKSFRRTPKCLAIGAIPVNASQDMSRFIHCTQARTMRQFSPSLPPERMNLGTAEA